jgi:hypothetical protein
MTQQEGDQAMHVADFAARAGVPVLRLAYRIDDVDPAFERPAVLVLETPPPDASENYALKSIPSVTAEKIKELSEEALATLLRSMLLGVSTDTSDASVSSSSSSSITRQPAFTCQHRSFEETLQHSSSLVPDDADSAPLGLTMIVKDEAGTIGETVRSAAPHIDFWTITDTGSTDGTQDVIRGNLTAVPGQLIEKPFVDFATTRNGALKAHGARTAYTFMPDADFEFENMWRLRAIAWRLEQECRSWSAHICGKSMRVIRKTADMELQMQVVFPTSQHALGELDGWHYSYPVHEFSALGRDDAGEYIVVPRENFRMRFMDGKVFHTKSEQRWRDFDIRILEAEKIKRPNDTRVSFYLARTYNQVGDNELALAEFQRRIDLGGWCEEVFHSLLDQGRILARMGRDPTSKFKKAYELVPNRAEPLYELAAWEQKQVDACDSGEDAEGHDEEKQQQKLKGLWLEACRFQHRALGFTYAKHAAALPYPSHSTLFVSSQVYDREAALQLVVHGYFLADLAAEVFRQGKVANDALASRFPGREPHASNVVWYEKLKQKIESELAVAAVAREG